VPSRAYAIAQLLLGILLLVVGLRRHQQGPRPRQESSELLQHLDSLTLPSAAGIGVLIQPWPLVAAGAVLVLQADLSHQRAVAAMITFCLLASAGILGMQFFSVAAPEQANKRLGALRRWIESHRDAAITWLAIGFGGWFALQGMTWLL
jgi:hypothetical protein